MELKEYQESAKRTNKDLGSTSLNLVHMVLGMNSEFNELVEAIEKEDNANILEEISDNLWYAANYANLIELDLSICFPVFSGYFYLPKNNDFYVQMQIAISKLTDLEKKSLVYNKLVTNEERVEGIIEILMRINDVCTYYNLNAEIGMENNINKLKVRFPEKFTEHLANNRTLELERIELEKNV